MNTNKERTKGSREANLFEYMTIWQVKILVHQIDAMLFWII